MRVTEYMAQVINMTISLDELGLTNPECASDFAERCAFTKSMTVRISTDILWTSEDAADRAYDWLAVLMFGEFLAGLGTAPTHKIVQASGQVMAVDFTLRNNINEGTLTSLMQYGAALLAFQTDGTATCHFNASDIMDYEDSLLNFQNEIVNRVHVFHDLAGLYASEFLAGLTLTDAEENLHVTQLSKWITTDWQRRVLA
ncbi:MAG: hypothetical protein ACKO14_01220 [Armatimonadota bacterium]